MTDAFVFANVADAMVFANVTDTVVFANTNASPRAPHFQFSMFNVQLDADKQSSQRRRPNILNSQLSIRN
jgi:hypothetical protein